MLFPFKKKKQQHKTVQSVAIVVPGFGPLVADKGELWGPRRRGAGRCEKQVFGSVNMCNQVIRPAREDKHNLINTNTSHTHIHTRARALAHTHTRGT